MSSSIGQDGFGGYQPGHVNDAPDGNALDSKTLYGVDGNSEGGVSFEAKELETILASSGIPQKGSPFALFYYLIKDVFMDKYTTKSEKNINQFAQQLQRISTLLRLWDDVHAAFDSQNSKQFMAAMGNFLNLLCGKFTGNVFPTNGTPCDGNWFGVLVAQVSSPGFNYKKYFPTLGSNIVAVLQSVSNFKSLFCYFKTPDKPTVQPTDIATIWQKAETGGQQGLPDPEAITGYVNNLSENNATLGGISESESSKLQYAQNEFNQLQSFIKDMIKDWIEIRKVNITSMSSANK